MQENDATHTFTLSPHGKPLGELTVQIAEPATNSIDGVDIPHLCMTAMAAVCEHLPVYRQMEDAADGGDMMDDGPLPWVLTLRFGGAAEGRDLNRTFRHKDYATNVLTFVADDADGDAEEWFVGDVFVCVPVLLKEAAELEIPVAAHLQHLVVHGLLHLVGYDHELGEAEAAEMEDLERTILSTLGLPDPYLAHEALLKDS